MRILKKNIQKIEKWMRSPVDKKANSILYRLYCAQFFLETRFSSFTFDVLQKKEDFPTSLGGAVKHANGYMPCPGPLFKLLVKRALEVASNPTCFVDIGCGKGAACVYAVKYFGFTKVVGMDFSQDLLREANSNIRLSGYDGIQLQHADATNYKLPDEKLIVFLYNPFDSFVLDCFLKNNRDHFVVHNSVVVYMNATELSTFHLNGFLTDNKSISEKNCILKIDNREPIAGSL